MITILKLLAVQIFLFIYFLRRKKFHYFGASAFSSTLLAYITTAA